MNLAARFRRVTGQGTVRRADPLRDPSPRRVAEWALNAWRNSESNGRGGYALPEEFAGDVERAFRKLTPEGKAEAIDLAIRQGAEEKVDGLRAMIRYLESLDPHPTMGQPAAAVEPSADLTNTFQSR